MEQRTGVAAPGCAGPSGPLEFGILGPLAVWRDGRELPLGSPKQRTLLAVLLVQANAVVRTTTIVDELWGEEPPATAVTTVQVYVSRLRKLLGPKVVETRPTGYRLRVDPGALDLERFEALHDEGRRLFADGSTEEAGQVLRDALALWRGRPLADFEHDAFALSETARLEGLHLAALELRLETDLALGLQAEIVGELEVLVREHPLRETLRGLLMLALYRAGRQADALVTYQGGRAALLDEQGLDPSETLQQLEKAILRHDPTLDLTPGGSSARAAPSVAPGRKVVSVLFCEVAAYADERSDPEAIGQVNARCFALASAVVERYGGTVERFVDDEVMAVFGVPFVREDDALRALRAAVEIRDGLPGLGAQGRIGVSSGEVLSGAGSLRVTGDPVAVGKRLKEAAVPGEVLIGEATLELVREAAGVELVDHLHVKGRAEPVPAWRVVDVHEAPGRLHVMRFVGREHELAVLRSPWERVRDERRCELVTVVGEAGIGKSRLAAELLGSIDARVVAGRCLPYGEGITYWPVVEVLKELELPPDEAAAATIRSLVGEQKAVVTADEIALAFRKTLEHAAAERPLVVVLDDIHWGEATLLDLVEHVALLSLGAAILIVCLARPELVERRPAWPTTLRLEPLSDEYVDELLPGRIAGPFRKRIARAAGGNPLFVQEMLALADEREGTEELAVPPTLHALLAARVDRLEPDERSVLERGAVEGEVFHQSAVQALASEQTPVMPPLAALVRKGLITPDRTDLAGEDGFRFRHLLIRDAAYETLPKANRADLHERFAAWLEEHGVELVSLDELLGHHLERAYRYHEELGQVAEEIRALGARAADRLASAGHRALVRGDLTAAANLLGRALALGIDDPGVRVGAQVDLAYALGETGPLAEPDAMLTATMDAAAGLEDQGVELRALVQHAAHRLNDPTADPAEVLVVSTAAAKTFEQLGDPGGQALAERLASMALQHSGRSRESRDAAELALVHADASGDQATRRRVVSTLSFYLAGGPHGATPVNEGIRRSEELLESSQDDPGLQAVIMRGLSILLAMAGRFDEARDQIRRSSLVIDDRNQRTDLVFQRNVAHAKELMGDRAGAEEVFFARYARLRDAAGAVPDRPAMGAAVELAHFYCDDGRWDEAADCLSYTLAWPEPVFYSSWAVHRLEVQGRLAAHHGRHAEGLALVHRAVALLEPVENLDFKARVQLSLAEVERANGQTAAADAAVEAAIRLFEERGNIAAVARLRSAGDDLAQQAS